MNDLAGVLTSLATLIGVIGGLVMQWRGQTEAREGRVKLGEKVDVTAAKVDENTAVTKDTAVKLEEVHQATAAIAESTGTHQILNDDG